MPEEPQKRKWSFENDSDEEETEEYDDLEELEERMDSLEKRLDSLVEQIEALKRSTLTKPRLWAPSLSDKQRK